MRKRTDSWSVLLSGRDIRQRKSGIKGRRDIQLRANQTIGLIEVGGGLLLLPGFISDILGVLCLTPFTRRLLVGKIRRRAQEQAMRQRAFFDDQAARSGKTNPNVLEGEYERRD